MQLLKVEMFDKSGQWIHLETFEDFDNGLSELIDLWSSKATIKAKESALAHFKEDLEGEPALILWPLLLTTEPSPRNTLPLVKSWLSLRQC